MTSQDAVVAGIDVGSVSSEAVLMVEGKIVAKAAMSTGASGRAAADRVLEVILREAGMPRERVGSIVATGYGRKAVSSAHRTTTEITCHARGAHHLLPSVGTVIDIGGQDSKVIRVDSKGAAIDFVMNDRCAAGTGRFLEVMARALEVPLERMGEISHRAHRVAPISSMCTVFAESEVVSLVAEGMPVEEILAGLHAAVAERIRGMVQRMGLAEPVVMTGGVAHNTGVVRAIQRRLGCEVQVAPEPHLVGALGAALVASDAWSAAASRTIPS